LKKEGNFLGVLDKKVPPVPPVWLMRQAGRYLPEYRALRAKAGSFWTMCMDPVMAAEITLQPIRRFGFDAAIIFSDILTVPYAVGKPVVFTEGEGPSLPPADSADGLERDPAAWRGKLAPAYETLRCVRAALDPGTALLGFAGAPWTLATYMAAGRGGDEQRAAKLWGYRDPQGFARLLDLLGDCVAEHLIAQLDAGADAVQIFDSWASGLPPGVFHDWVIAPTARLVANVRGRRPQAKIIGFPRAATLQGYAAYAAGTEVDALSLDTATPMSWARSLDIPVQGNLDPVVLVAGGDVLARAVDGIVDEMRGRPFIFNLGHGVLPETPPEHVAQLVARVRRA
jgi:uroporphyrinogen decarboxylase